MPEQFPDIYSRVAANIAVAIEHVIDMLGQTVPGSYDPGPPPAAERILVNHEKREQITPVAQDKMPELRQAHQLQAQRVEARRGGGPAIKSPHRHSQRDAR